MSIVNSPTRGMSTVSSQINIWPALIDMMTSILMVFVLINFIRTMVSTHDMRSSTIQTKQSEFLDILNQEFVREIREGSIKVERHLEFLQITFSNRLLFRTLEYELSEQGRGKGRDIIRRLGRVLERALKTGYEQIQVEGHTDNLRIQRAEYPRNNWELSSARAISVVQLLLESTRLRPDLFSANGYGQYRPVATNDTESGRARNRRIEIRIFFSTIQGAGVVPARRSWSDGSWAPCRRSRPEELA